jgi:cytochrome c-type biogenesis protein CcmH
VTAHRLAALLALALTALLALSSPVSAATPRADFNDIEDEVMCDTCNVPLFIAESPRADQLRREIRQLIARGQTKDEVKATLKTRYGAAILALPDDQGFSLAAYLVPILVGLGLLALLLALLPRWRRRAREPALAGAGADADPLSVEDAARLDAELARFDGR